MRRHVENRLVSIGTHSLVDFQPLCAIDTTTYGTRPMKLSHIE